MNLIMLRNNRLVKMIYDRCYRFNILASLGFYNKMEDKEYIERQFFYIMKRKLNLNNPVTYNEKLQWLKLYDRNERYVDIVDKYEVRKYVKSKVGKQYLIPLLGVWSDVEEIDFNKLPSEFVLKCNHNSGKGMCICKDKTKIDLRRIKKNLKKGLKEDYYLTGREWPYKNVKRKVIAEKYIGIDGCAPDDYKFYVFNGKIDSVMVCKGREYGYPTFLFYDLNWNRLNYQYNEDKNIVIEKPKNFDKMIEIVNKLAEDFVEVRIDLYNQGGSIYFGEITLFNQSGYDTDITYDTDFYWGGKFDLPINK